MPRKGMVGIFSALLILSVVMAAYSTLNAPAVSAFSESELRAPDPFVTPALPAPPANIAGDTTARPAISVRILIGQVFAEYGGSVRIVLSNNDTRALFLEELLFEWVDTELNSSITVNRRINPGTSHEIKSLAIEGPPEPGLSDYQLKVRLLQFRSNRWYRMVSGNDDWLSFTEQSIEVMALADSGENPVSHNPLRYYIKTNDLVDFSSQAVADATESAISGMAPGYDMGKASAVFDWLVTNINYTEDPDGGDVWYSPDETLAMMAGDCEDYAMLLAAMVNHAGGTARLYLTVDHAFAAIYVGNATEDLERATADIRAYYRTPVPTHAFRDDAGYWMVADPLGSFYMGGLAVGQVPIEATADYWNTSFPESGTLYSVDVTGISLNRPIWLDPLFWVGIAMVFGFLAIVFALPGQAEKSPATPLCFICAGEISEDLYLCPHCQTTYHRACASGGAYCKNCGGSIHYQPPP